MKEYLVPTYYIDSDSPGIVAFADSAVAGAGSDIEKGVRLYYRVRDGFRYNPYTVSMEREHYRASYLLAAGEGFCIQKAILLAALARAAGIPSRLNFADVINHLTTENLRNLLKTDLFVFHGCTEMHLEGKWVKMTPAFNLTLCERFGVRPLEFDGKSDSLFHPFDRAGKRHMEYVHNHGSFSDFPYDLMISEFKKHYPHLVASNKSEFTDSGDFEKEAEAVDR